MLRSEGKVSRRCCAPKAKYLVGSQRWHLPEKFSDQSRAMEEEAPLLTSAMQQPPVVTEGDMAVELVRASNKTGFKDIIMAKPNGKKPYQARMWDKSTSKQRALPGLYETAEQAARALAVAKRDGYEWATDSKRRKRGEVRLRCVSCSHAH